MAGRFLCDVLEEMRQAHKTRNYSYFEGLIEEAQWMGSRMEAGLYDLREVKRLHAEEKRLKKKIAKLKKKAGEEKPGASKRFEID